MLTLEKTLEIMQVALDSLHRSGVVENHFRMDTETVLLGPGSQLDSMGFVTLITDIEERISGIIGSEFFVVLPDLEEMYPQAASLTVQMLANFLIKVSGGTLQSDTPKASCG